MVDVVSAAQFGGYDKGVSEGSGRVLGQGVKQDRGGLAKGVGLGRSECWFGDQCAQCVHE